MATTVADVSNWLEDLSGLEGQTALRDQGNYGLTQVTDEADGLYRLTVQVLTLAPPVSPAANATPDRQFEAAVTTFVNWVSANPPNPPPVLAQITGLTGAAQINPRNFEISDGARARTTAALLGLYPALEGRADFRVVEQRAYRKLLTQILTAGRPPSPTTSQAFIDSLGEGGGAASVDGLLDPIVNRVLNEVIARDPHLAAHGAGRNGHASSGYPAALYAKSGGTATVQARATVAAGYAGQISARRATVRREVTAEVDAALTALGAIDPLSSTVYPAQFQSLKRSIEADLARLKVEAERRDGPITTRVTKVLGRLGNATRGTPVGQLNELRKLAKLNPPANFPTVMEEVIDESLKAIDRSVASITVQLNPPPPRTPPPVPFGDRVARAGELLPVIAEITRSWTAEMDRAGYEINQRSIDEIETGSAELTKALANERVIADLRNLTTQLNKLADLAA